MAPALELDGIRKSFGATLALDGVTLEVRPGEVHALIGENGAGKSTLMNVLAGTFRPDAGEMRLGGKRYAPDSTLDARRARVALIHQELSLCPHLSVTENVLLGMESSRWGWVDWSACRRRALEVLKNFDHPEIRPERRVGELPVAARQVVEICRALSADVRIMLMDEPTSSLQREDVERLFALIRRLRDDGIAIVYISHFLEEVRAIADRYTVLRDGRSVASGEISSVSNDELISHMVGRPMGGIFPSRRDSSAGEVLLAVRDLTAPPVVHGASFELRRGEILGIAGLMGSGRTELVRALFGLDPVESGSYRLRGQSLALSGGKAADRLRQGFGYLSEDRKGEGLALPLSLADNLTLTRMSACSGRLGWLDLACQATQAQRWIGELGIRARTPAQSVRTLSGGNQQKVAIGRLLHQHADVLLLDEPTRGIDVGSKAQVYETIAAAAAAGKAVLMVSSYLPELFGMCDRLAVMSRGRLLPARPIDQWTPEAVLAAAIAETPDTTS
ncbi:MAG: sugar ABC transporter ATP-binding protein [Gemmatimonadetes bacterium]|nr:sugar ABC transporter ATP-binding protein [Gemmatimonadota bacterium]